MTRLSSRGVRRSLLRFAVVVVVAGLAGVAAAVGLLVIGGPSGLSGAATGGGRVKACVPGRLAGTAELTGVGSSSTTLAGAVVLRDKAKQPCTLHGTPIVRVVSAGGAPISVLQAPLRVRQSAVVTLHAAGSSSSRPDGGSSITWSAWGCPKDSFALVVRFPGWRSSITVPWGNTAGYSGAACSDPDQTIYVGPVAQVASAGSAA